MEFHVCTCNLDHDFDLEGHSYKKGKYRILPNRRASPNRCAPPKFLDHIGLPEVRSPKIYMTTQFNDRFNALLTICLLLQLITVTGPKSQVSILFQ